MDNVRRRTVSPSLVGVGMLYCSLAEVPQRRARADSGSEERNNQTSRSTERKET